jgi:hypothetical protein
MRKLKIGCGIALALFVILVAVLTWMSSQHEKGWRRIIAFNTTDKDLRIGVEYEDGACTESVPAHSERGFLVPPGKGRSVVMNPDKSIIRIGTKWMEIKPSDVAPYTEDLYIDANGEGNYAVVDIHFLYAGSNGFSQSINEAMNKGRRHFKALLPASDIMVFQSNHEMTILPSEKLPDRIRRGDQYLAFRRVNKNLTSGSEILLDVARQFRDEERK